MSTRSAQLAAELLTDFDIVADPMLAEDPHSRLIEALRNESRDIVFSPHNGGHWIVTRHELAHEILCDARRFGSFPIGVPANHAQRPRLIPLESDVGDHRRYRRLLLPVFAPDVVRAMEDSIRARTVAVLDSVLTDGEMDFLKTVAKPIPTRLFVSQMGLPEEDLEQFYLWENGFYRAPTEEERMACGQNIAMYLHAAVEQRQQQPGDDVISLLLASKVEGEQLTAEEVDAICYLLFLAGIDTVATMLSFIALFMARNPELWSQMRADQALLDQSCDELLRMHAFINLNRIVAEDLDFHGVPMKAGDNVVIPTFLTSRDEAAFPEPDQFSSERSSTERNRHHAFGAGAHKCLGLHLAKLEVRVVLQELAKRVDKFSVSEQHPPRAHGGTTMGWDTLPLVLSLVK